MDTDNMQSDMSSTPLTDASGTTGSTGAGSSTDGIAGMARNFASQAQQKAGEQVRSSLDKGRTRAVDTLQEVARTLKQANESGDNPTGEYMGKAGDQVERFASFLQNTDPKQMMTQTEAFARRQPALFLGGAFALGIIAARFLKSGKKDDANEYGSGYGAMSSDGRLLDRERSLSNFREPSGYGADSGFANDTVGDDSDWPNISTGTNTGMEDNTIGGSDLGPSSRR